MMFDDSDMGAGATACSYTDEFLDAAVAKIDATFGKGFAKQNPLLVAGYLQASAANLGAFMTAATATSSSGDLADALASAMEEMDEEASDAELPDSFLKKGN